MSENSKKTVIHVNFEASTTQWLGFKEKLDYLLAELNMTQHELADKLGVSNSAISQWKYNGVPKAHIQALCAQLGVSRQLLENDDLSDFKQLLSEYRRSDSGAYWRRYAQNHAVTGLELAALTSEPKQPGYKALYKEPQPTTPYKVTPKLKLNDPIRFKLALARAWLGNDVEVKSLLLIIDDGLSLQIILPEMQKVDALIHGNYYWLPSATSKPLYVGEPLGKWRAYLVLLAEQPVPEVMLANSQTPSAYVADNLVNWLLANKIAHKITGLEFYC